MSNKYIKALDDTRLCIRVDLDLKKWIADNGGSKFVRAILVKAYEEKEKETFTSDFQLGDF